jgi:hypothetical protein
VERTHGEFHVLFVNNDRGFDLRGGDHLDVNALFAQHAKHLAGNANVAAHADSDYGGFANFSITC